jgi:hypothetical protein
MSRINPPPAIPDVDPSTKAAFQQEILEKVTGITAHSGIHHQQWDALMGGALAEQWQRQDNSNQACHP